MYIFNNTKFVCKIIFLKNKYKIILKNSEYYFVDFSFTESKDDFNRLRALKEETPKDYYHYFKDTIEYNTKFPRKEIVDYYNTKRFNAEIKRLKKATSLKDYLDNSCSVDDFYKKSRKKNQSSLVIDMNCD